MHALFYFEHRRPECPKQTKHFLNIFFFFFDLNIFFSNQTDQGIYDEDLNNSQNPSLSEAFYLCNLVRSNQL